jgi:hypothetical protein
MKSIFYSLFYSLLLLISCKSNTDKPAATDVVQNQTTGSVPATTDVPAATVPVTGTTTTSAPATQATPKPQEPPQNAKGVWHFTCPKGCKGGGGAVGPCAKCGTNLAHNAAYHDGATPPNTNVVPNVPTTASTPATPAKPEPPQNAKGIWHFTCPKGCAGGAGAATPCAKCGTALAHNAVYHQ